MSCYSCTKSFSFFNKERECKNCGFAFCSNCLKKKCAIPKLQGQEAPVCSTCFKHITEPHTARDISPPSALLRRLETLDTPTPTITIYKDNPKMSQLRKGMSKEDQQIVDRLEKLHRERKTLEAVPKEAEVAERLAKLKGQDVNENQNRPVFYNSPSNKTSAEQVESLCQQTLDEIRIDKSRPDPEREIAERLARLRDEVPKDEKEETSLELERDGVEELEGDGGDLDDVTTLLKEISRELQAEAKSAIKDLQQDKEISEAMKKASSSKKECSDEDEDESERVIEQILSEAAIEDRQKGSLSSDSISPIEEGFWCSICEEDTKMRCEECDSNFCQKCFKEFHNDIDTPKHKWSELTPHSQN